MGKVKPDDGLVVGKIQKYWSEFPADGELTLIAAHRLMVCGQRIIAMELLQQALGHGCKEATVFELIGQLSLELKMPEIGEKIYLIIIEMDPTVPAHYANYVECLRLLEKYDAAIELLQSVIPQFPAYAMFWSMLANITREYLNDIEKARSFIREAYRLDPDNYNVVQNCANLLPPSEEAIELYRQAIKLEPDLPEAHVGLGICLLSMGRLKEGWEHYEYRLSPRLSSGNVVYYDVDVPVWNGENLKGKTILLAAEQGVGDEIFFAIFYARLLGLGASLVISCDDRLIRLYQQSFPTARVIGYEDGVGEGGRVRSFPQLDSKKESKESGAPDFYIPIGSLPKIFWPDMDAVGLEKTGYLKPNQTLVEQIKEKYLYDLNEKLVIGFSWRSGNMKNERKTGYMSFEGAKRLVALKDIYFVNLQYDISEAELAEMRDVGGDRFIHIEDIDLKNDFEMTLALIHAANITVGANTASQLLSIASNKTTWITSKGIPLWLFSHEITPIVPFAPKARMFFITENEYECMNYICSRLEYTRDHYHRIYIMKMSEEEYAEYQSR
jgi:tetratricopeptide (TPR) repeat protein